MRKLRMNIVAAVAISALCFSCGGQDNKTVAANSPVPTEADEDVPASLEAFVATSDLVVAGAIVAERPGRNVEDLQFTVYAIQITDGLAKSGVEQPRRGQRIEFEMSTRSDGVPIALNGRAIPEIGSRGVWFLRSIQGRLVINSTQGQFLVEKNGKIRGAHGHNEVVPQIEALETVERVLEAARKASPKN